MLALNKVRRLTSNTVDLPSPILSWGKQQDTHVRNGLTITGASVRDINKSQIRDQGAQYAYWDGEAAEQGG